MKQDTIDTSFEQCMKCTVCTVYCPVVAVNPDYPGPKQAGPDGERYRLKDPLFYDEALDLCLNCKRCEVACPSNVKIGDIIQSARIFDLGYYNSNMTGVYADEFVNFITNDLPRNFASWYEKNEKTVQKGLDKTLESYLE